jgi:uncharacterized protein DUF4432
MNVRDRLGRKDQLAAALPVRLDNGVRAVYLRNGGGIEALIVLDRAMDVAWFGFAGRSLVWHGPGGILPSHPGTLSDDEFERRFFGGLVTTCGLEAFGPAGSDQFGTWGQHGHVNHIAAEECSFRTVLDAPAPYVEVRGVIRQARMFGESLRLERCWRSAIGGTTLELVDRVTNDGGAAVPHMLLYHCNAGYPLLDEHTRLFISQKGVRGRDARSQAALSDWDRGGLPDGGFKEQVFCHDVRAADDGWAVARFTNAELANGVGLAVHFRPEQLPACFSWRMLGVRTYVMAVEPANCPTIEGRIAARSAGTLPFLQPHESKTYELVFRCLSGDGELPFSGVIHGSCTSLE